MRFTFSLLNAFSQRGQADNTVPQNVRELTQEELDQVHGGHGKDCHNHHNNNHHNHNHCSNGNSNSNSNGNSNSNNECSNYCDYSYYNCYTY